MMGPINLEEIRRLMNRNKRRSRSHTGKNDVVELVNEKVHTL